MTDRARAIRVLVVDDSPVARRLVASRLGPRGAIVTEAASFAEGSRVDGASFDAAILDVDLGDGDGVALAASLLARAPSLRVALFTSDPDAVAARCGAAPVFEKPGEADALVAWALAEV